MGVPQIRRCAVLSILKKEYFRLVIKSAKKNST